MRSRSGFTLVEVSIVSGLMVFLAMLLAAAWSGVGRPATELAARAEVAQEMEMALASLSRDLGGCLADSDGRLGSKKQARWVGWLQPNNNELWLCFDGGLEPNETADWGPPDKVIVYRLADGALVRWDADTGTVFTAARNLIGMSVTAQGVEDVRIELSFQCREVSATCTLIAKHP